jgi:chaperone required for assembly of F1-ATPase
VTGWGQRRRFWQEAQVRPEAAGFGVDLDGRPLRTPAGRPLLAPSEPLARAIAREWDALGVEIDPERLPLTRAANSAIDRVADRLEAVIDAIAEYGGTDLLCYRAEHPRGLAERQAAGWDPWLAWAARRFGAPLVAVSGVVHEPQPTASLAALRAPVAARDAFSLTALHELVALSGSLVLGLAVAERAIDAAVAWDLSRIDEAWQAEQWGADPEAEAAAEHRRRAFLGAAELLAMLDAGPARPPIR